MKRGQISNVLRRWKLIYFTDWLRFYLQKAKHRSSNTAFKKKHPDVLLPPDYLMYESFGIDYDKYYNGGYNMAKWLTDHFKKHILLKDKKILDWGCGPGRIIRHMPSIIGNDCSFYGTDYNEKSISWCKEHLPEISFNKNPLSAELPYDNDAMDVVYGISIFTHLSEKLHYDWFMELHRILKPGGILLLSTHGNNFKVKLDNTELKKFEQGQLIVRGNVKEGHRTFCAFQPSAFMNELFSGVTILEHLELVSDNNAWIPQDIWIVKK